MLMDLFLHGYRRWNEQSDLKPQLVSNPAFKILEDRASSSDGSSDPSKLIPIGTLSGTRNSDSKTPFLITPSEAQHGLTLGKTGSGKTSWALTYADGLVKAGFSIAAISPHEDLAEGMLKIAKRNSLPTVHIDFSGRGSSISPWSFLHAQSIRPDESAHLASSLISASFGAGAAAGHIRSTLNPLFFLLASCPDRSLLDAERLVKDPKFAKTFVSRLVDPLPAVSSFFNDLAGKGRSGVIQRAQYALNRINALMSFRGVRFTLCGSPRVDLREVIKGQCAIIVSVPAAQLGENAALLGGLFIEYLRLLLYQRDPNSSEPKLMVFVDELGSMAQGNTQRLAAMLSECRKYSAYFTGLAQSLSQIEGHLVDAFMANANLYVLGRLSPKDAARFAKLPNVGSTTNRLTYEGLWVEGKSAWFEGSDGPNQPHNSGKKSGSKDPAEQELSKALIEAPPRTFLVHLPINGVPRTVEMRSLDLDESVPDGASINFLGQQSVTDIENQVRSQLWIPKPAPTSPARAIPVSRAAPSPANSTAPSRNALSQPAASPPRVIVTHKPAPMSKF